MGVTTQMSPIAVAMKSILSGNAFAHHARMGMRMI